MEKLSLALDWTPNINHIGFFVAQEKGFYQEYDLEVEITDPSLDNYEITPAKKVEMGAADFALCPTESVISYRTKSQPFDLIAIAAVLQYDLSAIVVKADAGIHSPKDLDGKLYSSYKARYEDGIVMEMIKNDGGAGNLNLSYPAKLGIWNTLLQGEADATWIFLNWEGVSAQSLGNQLKYFRMRDYQIPYSYSPVIAASEAQLSAKLVQYQAFLQASKKGFLHCQAAPEESIEILRKFVPAHEAEIDLQEALAVSLPAFGNKDSWGQIDPKVISSFFDWIFAKGLETQVLAPEEIFTLSAFHTK
ncbi:MAG: ABC transporter substrate-binding protein [Bacteroidota bacterium]